MPDLGLSVTISRASLGLSALQINDHVAYYVGPTLFGGSQAWQRNQVGSPFLDGTVTTYRTRQMVTETLAIEIFGQGSVTTLQSNMSTLVQAFMQDQYNIVITMGGTATWTYMCEAADFTVVYEGYRWVAKQAQITFSIPRQPVPTVGAF